MIFLLLFPFLVHAETQVKYLRNYDGDTITFDLGKVRVRGVDTGELNSKKPCEKEHGLKAQKFVEDALKKASRITLTNHKEKDIYKRILADVYIDGKNLKDLLLEKNLAAVYVPKRFQKVNWCRLMEKTK